jgi:hypothetical protein
MFTGPAGNVKGGLVGYAARVPIDAGHASRVPYEGPRFMIDRRPSLTL